MNYYRTPVLWRCPNYYCSVYTPPNVKLHELENLIQHLPSSCLILEDIDAHSGDELMDKSKKLKAAMSNCGLCILNDGSNNICIRVMVHTLQYTFLLSLIDPFLLIGFDWSVYDLLCGSISQSSSIQRNIKKTIMVFKIGN